MRKGMWRVGSSAACHGRRGSRGVCILRTPYSIKTRALQQKNVEHSSASESQKDLLQQGVDLLLGKGVGPTVVMVIAATLVLLFAFSTLASAQGKFVTLLICFVSVELHTLICLS